MQTKFVSLIILLLSITTSLYSQSATVRGIALDSMNNEPIIGASVLLTTQADSTLIGFDITTEKGEFKIPKIEKGEYYLQITYMGYRNYVEYVTVEKDNGEIILPVIKLTEGNTLLEEVVVKADRIPILIKKDTIEYNAGSFEVEDGANLEELLRQLPGVQVDADGNIKAQGQDVDEILVEGEEFFGSDPSVVAKNLPAETIDKVQVFDTDEDRKEEKNNGEETTETETKTINIKLKDDKKRGYFGKGVAGGGTDQRFITELSVNRFDTKEQLSFIGKFNNINSPGFSFDDYVSFLGGYENAFGENGNFQGGYTRGNNATFSEGEKKTGIAGLNYSRKLNKKVKFGGNYILKYVQDEITTESERINFQEGETLFTSNTVSEQDNRLLDHNANAKLEWEVDSTQNIILATNFKAKSGDYDNIRQYDNISGQEDLQRITGNQNNKNNSLDWNSRTNLNYVKKFKKKKGRTFKTYSSFSLSNDDNDQNSQYQEQEFSIGMLLGADSLNRQRDIATSKLNFSQRLRYAEPIGKFTKITTNYRLSYNQEEANNNAFDSETGTVVQETELSRDFGYVNFINSIGSNVNYEKKSIEFSLGFNLENQQVRMEEIAGQNFDFDESFLFFLPRATFTYSSKQNGRMRLSYRTSSNLPSYSQWSPVVNNTNPTSIYEGNRGLKPSYRHEMTVNYYKYNSFSNEYIQFWTSYGITSNPIVNLSSFNNLVEVINPFNSNENADRLGLGGSYGRPIRFLKADFDLWGSLNYSKNPFSLNGQEITQYRINQNYEMEISNKNRKKYAVDLSYGFGYNFSTYSDSEIANITFMSHSGNAKFRYNLPHNWIIGCSNRVNYYPDSPFDGDQTIWLLSASVEKKIFKDKSGKIRLAGIDLLNENTGISQQANAFYSENSRSNALGRFVLLSFHYDFSTFKGKKK